ncbi:hypothetical protein S7711_03009 [Stachybotrys chartarum IBT 7711]|uniref:Uncharacterized protein n=1 Tax=Stachybotrys chartarum (strain CBS 109288 / IBT 7711) TaxID=1280523 RepID=A0A084APB9_STACB|nr:hypothetical protein S7711_03009 [Stachybotrys chartarum IBT 7711]
MALPDDHVPVITPLPEPPSSDFFTETQWEVLHAILDGALPSIVAESSIADDATQVALPDADFEKVLALAARPEVDAPTPEVLAAYLADRPSLDPAFREDVLTTLATSPQRQKLAGLLGFLATRTGSLMMTGYWTPVHQQPTRVREAILKAWVNSRFPTIRVLGKTMTTMAQKSACLTSPHLQSLIGYTDKPKDWKAGLGYEYSFVQVPPGDEPHVITTDVVIVGSGCGGAVCAKNLAEAGHRVLVVDKGYHFPPTHLPMNQTAALRYLYDHNGVYVTEDSGGVNVVNGGAWGGGGTVNWSVCLKLQDFVRKQWAEAGLPFFESPQFDESIDRVWNFMGASSSAVRHNHGNRVILEGCGKLGWKSATAAQNTDGKEHYCGQCNLGCGSAEKRGPSVSWLPAAGQAGAQFMEGLDVDKVLFDEADATTAIGVEGLWKARGPNGEVHTPVAQRTRRRVVVKAKKVIVSAGALWTPVLLMKSGVQNVELGHNLHLHPCNVVTGTYKEEIRPWEGGIITHYSTEFENLDGNGFGVKLECTCMVPYSTLAMRPWASGLESKLAVLKHSHTNSFIALTRDRDGGRVFPCPMTGCPRLDYVVSDYDRAHTMDGVEALAKLCYVTGATQIEVALPGVKPFVPERGSQADDSQGDSGDTATTPANGDPEFTDTEFASWLEELRRVGNRPPTAVFLSAHQMGTCRMGATEDQGVVDEKGRVWATKNLLVADSSVFPSASGVNPMITVMATADWISRCLDEELRSERAM